MKPPPLQAKKLLQAGLLLGVLALLFGLLTPPQGRADGGARLWLRAGAFDPLLGSSLLDQAASSSSNTVSGVSLHLIQFSGPVQAGWKTAVQAAGARLYGYIPDNAFLAVLDPQAEAAVNRLPFVRWSGPYLPAYRLAPELSTLARSSGGSQDQARLLIQALPDADLDDLSAQVRALGGSPAGQSANSLAGYLQASLPPAQLAALAALDEVVWVELDSTPALLNDRSGQVTLAAQVRPELSLYGQGQVAAVADSGLDRGDLADLHPDFQGRVLQTFCLGRPDDCADYIGHGTHVAGSLLGSGLASGGLTVTHQYTGSFAGIAPEAGLVFQSISDAAGLLGGLPQDYGDLLQQAYDQGARVHSNSWGASASGAYTLRSQQVDQAAWELKDLLVLFAAGNAGYDADENGIIDPGSLNAPATAKNVLAVGASENNRPELNGEGYTWGQTYNDPIAADLKADDPNGMAAFSSRGPAQDGRIKPDLVAPGTYLASTRSRQFLLEDDFEAALDDYTQVMIDGGSGASAWDYSATDPRSGVQAWHSGLHGAYAPGGATFLLGAPRDIRRVGSGLAVEFWHQYTLGGDNRLGLIFTDAGLSSNYIVQLDTPISATAYTHLRYAVSTGLLDYYGLDLENLRVGFGLLSASGVFDSEWRLDDLRLGGTAVSTLSQAGLTETGDSLDEAYWLNSGTSMATPQVAGAAVLARQWLSDTLGLSDPSAALLKAVLVNGATDLSPGQYGQGANREIPAAWPNNVAGWGRVNLADSLSPPAPAQVWVEDQLAGLSAGQAYTYTFTTAVLTPTLATTGGPLRLALAWSDYPGQAAASIQLVNDLDLELIAPDGTHYYGNSGAYAYGKCLRAGAWDACNNLEAIRLAAAPPGTYTLVVHAYNIPQGPQPFALAAWGDDLRVTRHFYLPLVH